ncbi:DNA starvation/stationary phase protection protein [Microvirga sp. STS02]|uniref:Dps family protein n=1 Tax=Hymenobacter negativus TaxID=2795026 RepID=UPI0018DE00A8|nr:MULTISPECIES: DNA starvation/stationary phase protection protein [Bacteria]MBH8567591.1 DNA starvation/stationary phase protection protein [Hymenobacter negativus]MBR7207323.1 DNA starvation/stationary phase protection protein [Microvirga sp. STS02]
MAAPAKTAAPKAAPKKAPAPKASAKAATASTGKGSGTNAAVDIQPILNQQNHAPAPTQRYGTVSQRLPIGLDEATRQKSVTMLNQLLADTITLRDMYKKHHWQVVGPTFYQLHLLYDKHYEEQATLVDTIAERIQILGGVAVAMAHDVAELTSLPRIPRDREEAPIQVSRLLSAHQSILKNCHDYAKKADDSGDDGTNDLIVSDLMRTNEMQVWFVSEHVVDSPLTRAE